VRHRTDRIRPFRYAAIEVQTQHAGTLIGHWPLWTVDTNPESSRPFFPLLPESTMNKFNRTLAAALLAVTLVSVVGCASTSNKEGTGEYVDDAVITTKVKAAIFNESTLKSTEINVETYKGVVQLSGFVNSQADINKAVSLARSVKGVTGVKNDMRLK
jgi:osmotically-inducible protein OsmY